MRRFVLVHDEARRRCADFAMRECPAGYEVIYRQPTKKRAQEEKYHAMIADIHASGRFVFLGRSDWSEEDIKRLLVEAFEMEMKNAGTPLQQSGRVVPSIDLCRTVQLGIQTRQFRVKEASAFIEFLYAYGTELGVRFKDDVPVAQVA